MASPACISGLMDHQNLLEGRVNQVGIKLQTRPRHWVRRLEECARTPWQLYQGANPRERREKARPASQTSPESHPSFPGWATNPFPGSRPCMTLAAAPVPPLQPPPPHHGASPPYPPAMLALLQVLRQGPSTSSPQGLGISCCSESLDAFFLTPWVVPFLTTLLTLQVCFWISGRAACPRRSHSSASPPHSH